MVQYDSGMFGGYEILVIVLVVLLLFGGRKIPELMKGLGKGIRQFKEAAKSENVKNDIKGFQAGIKDIGNEINETAKPVNDVRNLLRNPGKM